MDLKPRYEHLRMTADITSAYASHNKVSLTELVTLVQAVYAAVGSASRTGVTLAPEETQEPAVPVKRSLFPDYLVCLEDGKKLKLLKRHLQTAYQMTPQQYRDKWNLPSNYPMVAPNYAERRSSLAKEIGLGRKRTSSETQPQVRRIPEGVSSRRKAGRKAA